MGNTLQTQSLFVLREAFLNNEEVALREFYIAEFPKTKYYILKNGGSTENADDIFQEAYLSCWEKLTSGKFCPDNKKEIEAYLFTIAKNKWIDHVRNASKKKTIPINEKAHILTAEESQHINESEEKEQQLAITMKAFENLGQACKDLLTHFYFHKLSLRTIAEKLDMEVASAKNKKYRCIQKLKELAENQKYIK